METDLILVLYIEHFRINLFCSYLADWLAKYFSCVATHPASTHFWGVDEFSYESWRFVSIPVPISSALFLEAIPLRTAPCSVKLHSPLLKSG